MRFKIVYRTQKGTDVWECAAMSADDAEDLFRDMFGWDYQINGVYKQAWVAA